MIEPGIDTHLELTRDARGIEVRAYVSSAPPRPLRWRLETVARSPGGTSNVSQSGTITGGSDRPVTVSSVSPNSTGSIVLTIYDGTRQVAREQARIEADASTGE